MSDSYLYLPALDVITQVVSDNEWCGVAVVDTISCSREFGYIIFFLFDLTLFATTTYQASIPHSSLMN